jgi:hypothetical protein
MRPSVFGIPHSAFGIRVSRQPFRTLVLGLTCLCACDTLPASAQEQPSIPRVVVEDDGSHPALELIERAETLPVTFAVRIALPGPSHDAAYDARLDVLSRRRIPVWLSVPAPGSAAEVEIWRAALRRTIDRHAASLAVLEVAVDGPAGAAAAFAVQVASTEARTSGDRIQVALGGAAMRDPDRRIEIYTSALAPYVDLLSVPRAQAAEAAALLSRVDPGAGILIAGWHDGPVSERAIVDALVEDLGRAVVAGSWPVELLSAARPALAALSGLLSHQVSMLEPAAVGLRLAIESRDVTPSLVHRVLFDTETFSTVLVFSGDASEEPLAISLRVPIEGTPALLDLMTGERLTLAGYTRDPATGEARASARLTGRPMLVDFNEGATAIGEQSVVTAERSLTVGEIISKHQRQQLAQDRAVERYAARARMQQYFRPQETDAGYDILTENRYFVAGDGIEWEELSFAVNGRKFGPDRPPLPLLQPEKVLSLPLQLRFDEGYRYELAGTGRVDGFDCYEVRFEPVRDDPSLYRGTIWIDRRTFARVRVHARRGDLPGMVVTNEETLRYAPVVAIANQPVFLLSSLEGTQNMLIAGRIVRVEKRVSFSDFQVNAPDFDELRTLARQSDRVMFRETPNGLRDYVKRGDERIVSDRLSAGAKAMAFGVIVDPSYAVPLPIFGINVIDFSFGNPDTQLAMLFAGVLAAGNIQRPQLGSKRLDASLDFFAIAAPSSERIYGPGGEIESERVLTWPLSTGANLGWRVTPFQTATLQYQLRFDGYVRDTTTSETFVVPSSTITNGLGVGWELNRRGYTVVLNGSWYSRLFWNAWGMVQSDGGVPSTSNSYARFTASVSRDIIINPFQKIHLNGAWFGGRNLDRFVKYQFGLFDATRIHGVPASVRFGELAMARGSYSFNVFDQYRFDVFLDHAWGRDGSRDGWQAIPGIGAAINLPAPWGTILRTDVGKAWLPDRYGGLGSMSLQVMLLKPMR